MLFHVGNTTLDLEPVSSVSMHFSFFSLYIVCYGQVQALNAAHNYLNQSSFIRNSVSHPTLQVYLVHSYLNTSLVAGWPVLRPPPALARAGYTVTPRVMLPALASTKYSYQTQATIWHWPCLCIFYRGWSTLLLLTIKLDLHSKHQKNLYYILQPNHRTKPLETTYVGQFKCMNCLTLGI